MFNTKIAAILVGGKGTRLQSLISDVPKPLAPVGNKPFLFLLLHDLAAAGITDVVLLTGYMHDKIAAACGDGSQFDLSISYSQELTPLGTGGALKQAQKYLQKYPEFLVLNGDTYLEFPLDAFTQYVFPPEEPGLIGVTQLEDTSRYGTLEFEPKTQHILSFREKDPTSHKGYVNAGIYKLKNTLLERIPEKQFISLETEIFPKLLTEQSLIALPCQGKFRDIGVPESYLEFVKDYLACQDAKKTSRSTAA